MGALFAKIYYDMKNENCPELPEHKIWNKK